MFGKKKTFGQKMQATVKKRDKKLNKRIKKLFKTGRRSRLIFKIITKGPAWFEFFMYAAFAVVVCYLFWRKAKDPTFLENFGETKIS